MNTLHKFMKSAPNLTTYSWSKSDAKLEKAVESKNAKKVATLLKKKSLSPTKLGPQGKSVFHIACVIGNEQIVDLLLEKTHDVNDTTIQGNSALQLAASLGHTYTVEKLIQAKASVNQRDSNNMTALHHACAGTHLNCVKVLLAGKADPQAVENGGKTALFYSAHRGNIEICQVLLEKGANINWQDQLSVTPLMIAAKEGHVKVVDFLLKRGANPEMTDRDGNTAAAYAAKSGHTELQQIFKDAPIQAFDSGSGHSERDESRVNRERAVPFDYSPSGATAEVADTDDESRTDVKSISSLNDSSVGHPDHQDHSPPVAQASVLARKERQYNELREEHEQLIEDYSSLSIENLRLRDKVETQQKKLADLRDQGHQESDETVPKEVFEELKSLKDQLEEAKKQNSGAEQTFSKGVGAVTESERTVLKQIDDSDNTMSAAHQTKLKGIAADRDNPNLDNTKSKEVVDSWMDSDEDDATDPKKRQQKQNLSDNSMIAMLRSQIVALRQENEQLKAAQTLPNGISESWQGDKTDSGNQGKVSPEQLKFLALERDQLKEQITELKEEAEKHQLNGAVEQEEFRFENSKMAAEIDILKQEVASLQDALEAAKNDMPTDAQRLDAILAGSRNFEEVNFDEEGFVEGRDMTKEEFLQAQNQQLKTHCGLLTEELEKLRATFDAILKAGDNLQADYDQLAADKDALQDELEVAVKEKATVINENEFLLTDNNDLHENLKTLVHELEKMQEKFQAAQLENEELKRSVGVASKVGEVTRLLEERDALQQRCTDLEATSQRLQHDHNILLEEVQSLSESNNQLTTERDQLAVDLEEMEIVCQQQEVLQQDYQQLELDFAELLREKQALEAQISTGGETTELKATVGSETGDNIKELLAEKQQLEEVINGLSRHNVAIENKMKLLETKLAEAQSASSPSGHEKQENHVGEIEDGSKEKEEEIRKNQEEIMSLKKQIIRLNQEIVVWEKRHQDTVSTYRTHLLSAVQGHMDPDVKDALYHIIELRSMEQFC